MNILLFKCRQTAVINWLRIINEKLINENMYQYDGKLINMGKLYYRFYNAQRIISDIFEGLGGMDA